MTRGGSARSGSSGRWLLSFFLALVVLPQPVAAQTGVDVALEAGVHEITNTWDGSVADFDSDGWPDVLVGRHGSPARLYRNQGDGTFTEVPVGFPKRDRHSCEWGDANIDGRLDVYCTIGAHLGDGMGRNELWMQEAAGVFRNRAGDWGVQDKYGRGRKPTFLDANGDAYPDLFVGNDYPRSDGRTSPNRIFLNDRGVRFLESRTMGLTKEVGGLCAQAADYDEDGWEDLLVCGKYRLLLYRNILGGAFQDVTTNVGLSGKAEEAHLVDMNRDGRLDVIQARVGSFVISFQQPSGGFGSPVTIRSLQSGRSLATGDINGDGYPDVYVMQGKSFPDLMLVNDRTGRGFEDVAMPQAASGRGDRVLSLDYDRNGVSDFFVLNGLGSKQNQAPGPNQLITF